jgi:hypothetical protein
MATRTKKRTPKQLKVWANAAKACRTTGKIGSKSKLSCMKKFVRKQR